MIEEVTGIRKIRMLYLQLLYRCNFTCLHCFHGKRLQYADAFTADEEARREIHGVGKIPAGKICALLDAGLRVAPWRRACARSPGPGPARSRRRACR